MSTLAMDRQSASSTHLQESRTLFFPPPIRLVRTFRSDFRPIPFFLQDILSDSPCATSTDNQSRIIDLLKNIQLHQAFDQGSQGKLWFEIRRLLKKDILSDSTLHSDGRLVRNYLMKSIEHTDNDTLLPRSPSILFFKVRSTTKKLEIPTVATPVATLSLNRQTSQ